MNFLYTDARWTEHFVEVNDPHKEGHHVRFYFEPPQRTWVGLTDEDMQEVERWVEFKEEGSGRIPMGKLTRYIEAKLKEKNCDNRN